MKKLSIVLAVVFALSCFSLFAFAADYSVTLNDYDTSSFIGSFTQAEGDVSVASILAQAPAVSGKTAKAVYDASKVQILSATTISADTTLYIKYEADAPTTVTVTLNCVDKNGAPLSFKGNNTFSQATGTVSAASILAKAPAVENYEAVSVKDASGVILDTATVTEDTTFTVVYSALPEVKITVHFESTLPTIEKNMPADYTIPTPEDVVIYYRAKIGTVLTAADVLETVKDNERFKELVSKGVIELKDTVLETAPQQGIFKSEKLEGDTVYQLQVTGVVSNMENLAKVIGKSLGNIDWGTLANANMTVINEIMHGAKAALDSILSADAPASSDAAPAAADSNTDAAGNAAVTETPDTGVGAVAGAAVIVLALSATTAVILRKKED